VYEMSGIEPVRTRRWGAVTERRFALPSGLEVELGMTPPSWAATDPMDEGTRRVVTDGVSVVYDPKGILARLLDACGRSEAEDGSRAPGVGHA
jgi:hypothetical protein